ncbi:MAG: signal peptide peptidase SppA [Bacteroidales bacterium]|nr:signal peptide peptidase SppA [Bacteroidales bacterium]
MRQFFKFMFASMLGFIIAGLLLLFIFIGILVSIASFSEETTVVKPNTVLHLKLDQPIIDRSPKNPFSSSSFSGFKTNPGLNDYLENIEKASNDPNIKGILIEPMLIPAGLSTLSEIREALEKFRESGKFVISYSENYFQTTYYLATVADKIYLNPEGMFELKGLTARAVFLKGMLEKLNIEPQVISYGKYKSAADPLIFDKLTDANREQLSAYVNGAWSQMLAKMAEARNLSVEELNAIADAYKIEEAEDALEHNLVDALCFKDQLLLDLKERLEIAESEKISFVELGKYMNAPVARESGSRSRDKIAVIYAQGTILPGEGDETTIGSEKISATIRMAREDKNVKGIVLRVNSGGGSALASEVILREVLLAKAEKPVVASFGDVAASGGYYIACGADKIVATSSTITGSIGVISMIPNMQKFFNNKLGITFDEVKTNEFSDFIPFNRPMNDQERKIMERMTDNIYEVFITHVAAGRNMTKEEVDAIGQGRIWIGTDALEIGLIDQLGGLNDAIELTAQLAGLEDWRVTELPVQKDFLTMLMEDFSGSGVKKAVKTEMGEYYTYYEYLKNAASFNGIQARMPFEVEVY